MFYVVSRNRNHFQFQQLWPNVYGYSALIASNRAGLFAIDFPTLHVGLIQGAQFIEITSRGVV
jgi:hypothetical protein